MASLFKRTYYATDPKTGKRVRRKTSKWYGRYRDADGVERRVPLCTDRSAAQQMLHQLVRRGELGQAGLADPFEDHHKRPLAEHLQDFRRHLEAKRNSADHVELTVTWVRAVIDG